MVSHSFTALLALAASCLACDDCYGPRNAAAHVRNVRRMQPGAENAVTQPRAPLAWGQINFLHTTDTHGWLEGHLKEQNYGADWGDYVSFTRHMKQKAGDLGVDLLLIDTGDLHDGNGLSDATSPNGADSNLIFENVDYDLLTIGNHELYISDIAYETFNQFSKVYGDKYITSNVQILNPSTGQLEYIGSQYRYFTTQHGLRIMAFGVLFDFTGNSNVSKVTTTADLVKESWFLDAVNYPQPIDLFLVIGHNPPRPTASTSTFGTLQKTIRNLRPNTPIQAFGGHTHVRDFVVYDTISTGLESGRYCETLGWLSMSGIDSSSFNGNMMPRGVPNPTQRAIKVGNSTTSSNSAGTIASTGGIKSTGTVRLSVTTGSSGIARSSGTARLSATARSSGIARSSGTARLSATAGSSGIARSSGTVRLSATAGSSGIARSSGTARQSATAGSSGIAKPSGTGSAGLTSTATPKLVYARRYLDWNRLTFAYHAAGSQDNTFDDLSGLRVTSEITADRTALNLTALYGCAPATYCQTCKPFGADGNIFGLLKTALSTTVINQTRADIPRFIILNTGSIRFDLVKGPFTFDDSFIVSPFTDGFQYIPNVPYDIASQVLPTLNIGPFDKRSILRTRDFGFTTPPHDSCVDPLPMGQASAHEGLRRRDEPLTRGLHRRQTAVTPGYITTDDFGTNGDDTPHSVIPSYPEPENFQANASFPATGGLPATVDLVFLDYIAADVLSALKKLGTSYTVADVSYYLPKTFTTNSYLPAYAKIAWQSGVPNCPVGQGIGFSSR